MGLPYQLFRLCRRYTGQCNHQFCFNAKTGGGRAYTYKALDFGACW
ncbi:Uncharacterised protein [Serratia quinivorans]|nr:Uncharacterised protein [Serratia quinivorans]CAI2160678.1 Uncharacterised protein [Serratia quinivorans]